MTISAVSLGKLASAYVKAKTQVLAAGYADEIIWQRDLKARQVTEHEFLKECAWVILCAGMRESVIRMKFPQVSEAFFQWRSAEEIALHQEQCVSSALVFFKHERKIKAISQCARIVHERGFRSLRNELASDPINVLQQFPYIGPATSYHVAKNIGFSVSKPDRHLCRLSELSGYDCPADLCRALADYIGDPIPVVDIVLWRFATLQHDYLAFFLQSHTDA